MEKKTTLLIVDDDNEILETLSEYFQAYGYETVLAPDGEIAVQLLKYKDIDIVITDIRMPKMNGLSLLKHIRTKTNSLPVILMTGYELSKAELACLSYQADAYITKPFSSEYLNNIIKKIIVERGKN
jgi:DNA-binding response OmpR family regulator